MAKPPFLKSIRPVNLLSFGPNTQEIELRPLNILIGPNGSGKSNLIEIIGLLSGLPGRDPWSTVIETGGADEWIWKGPSRDTIQPSLSVTAKGQLFPREASVDIANLELKAMAEKPDSYFIALKRSSEGAFEVASEAFRQQDRWENDAIQSPFFTREGWNCVLHANNAISVDRMPSHFTNLDPRWSALSLSGVISEIAAKVPHIHEFASQVQDISLYRDWSFGVDAAPRDPQPAGLDSYHLDEDMRNLAQVLKAWRDRGDQASFHRLIGLMTQLYEPARDVDVELLGTHLRIMIKEEDLSSRTPATRLSDGTLRWLAMLTILLAPSPPSLVCLEEPELGLHPDMIHTLADLLVEASSRTQLVVTTHSDALVDAFTETPEVVCVCEKVEGSTVIQRLDRERLKVWLDQYSLGKLWMSGEIGGNRW
jgi:predicted ATPase